MPTKKREKPGFDFLIDVFFKKKLDKGFKVHQDKALIKAGKQVAEEIEEHFNSKEGGWPLDYHYHLGEIFNKAYGHDIEDYLFMHLVDKGYYIELGSDKGIKINKVKKQIKRSKIK